MKTLGILSRVFLFSIIKYSLILVFVNTLDSLFLNWIYSTYNIILRGSINLWYLITRFHGWNIL